MLQHKESGIFFEARSASSAVTILKTYGTKASPSTVSKYSKRNDGKLFLGWSIELITAKNPSLNPL